MPPRTAPMTSARAIDIGRRRVDPRSDGGAGVACGGAGVAEPVRRGRLKSGCPVGTSGFESQPRHIDSRPRPGGIPRARVCARRIHCARHGEHRRGRSSMLRSSSTRRSTARPSRSTTRRFRTPASTRTSRSGCAIRSAPSSSAAPCGSTTGAASSSWATASSTRACSGRRRAGSATTPRSPSVSAPHSRCG